MGWLDGDRIRGTDGIRWCPPSPLPARVACRSPCRRGLPATTGPASTPCPGSRLRRTTAHVRHDSYQGAVVLDASVLLVGVLPGVHERGVSRDAGRDLLCDETPHAVGVYPRDVAEQIVERCDDVHLDRDMSVPAPTSDPTTTTPILPQPWQSTRYSTYPYRRHRQRIGALRRHHPHRQAESRCLEVGQDPMLRADRLDARAASGQAVPAGDGCRDRP